MDACSEHLVTTLSVPCLLRPTVLGPNPKPLLLVQVRSEDLGVGRLHAPCDDERHGLGLSLEPPVRREGAEIRAIQLQRP
jgi:hypothetical protein